MAPKIAEWPPFGKCLTFSVKNLFIKKYDSI